MKNRHIKFSIDDLPFETAYALSKLLGLEPRRIADLHDNPIRVEIIGDTAVVWVTSLLTVDARRILGLLQGGADDHD